MTEPITVETIRERLEADKRKPSRLASWDEIEYLLEQLANAWDQGLARGVAYAHRVQNSPTGETWEPVNPYRPKPATGEHQDVSETSGGMIRPRCSCGWGWAGWAAASIAATAVERHRVATMNVGSRP